MGWYDERVLPGVLDRSLDTAEHRRIRRRVTAGLHGTVLEVGYGSGHNLAHLPPQVRRVLAVEPSTASLRRADERSAATSAGVEVVAADVRDLPLPAASVDAVLCTWSLCSIADPVAAVREIHRVLRPEGTLHFVEHGLAPDDDVRRWQRRLNPIQRRVAGGCTLDNDVPALLRQGGLTVTQLDRYYGPGWPRAIAATYEGRATASH